MRRTLPSILVAALAAFLFLIYAARPTADVGVLSLVLLGFGLYFGFGSLPRGTEFLAGITAIMSFVAIGLLGYTTTGTSTGFLCAIVLWIAVISALAAVGMRRVTLVERGQMLVVNKLPENRAIVFREGLHRPLMPFERRVAVLPTYELVQSIELKMLNTESLFNVDRIEVLVRYLIESPRDVVFALPNRERSIETMMKDRKAPVTNSDYVAFWTELIQRQMRHETEEVVRAAIANIGGPTEVAKNRSEHARRIGQRLQSSVEHWGMKILEVRFLEVEVHPDRIRAANRDKIIERETRDSQLMAERQAYLAEKVGEAQAKSTANMVSAIAQALKEQAGAELRRDGADHRHCDAAHDRHPAAERLFPPAVAEWRRGRRRQPKSAPGSKALMGAADTHG